MMKKILLGVFAFAVLANPSKVLADHEKVICPQPYGGGVVCGVKTHKPVEAGLAENLALAGALAIGASGIFLHLSKKAGATA